VSLQGRLAHFGAPGARVPAVESGVLVPPAHRGWCLVQAPRWGVTRARGAVWGSQIGTIWTSAGGAGAGFAFHRGHIHATWAMSSPLPSSPFPLDAPPYALLVISSYWLLDMH
jgi:hypothetical protein